MRWSPQQETFLAWCENGKGSCVLEAVAGAGKSTTLIEAARRVKGSVALLAYNKKIAEELDKKLKAAGLDWQKAKAGTVHSFGFAAYRKSHSSVKVDRNKLSDILDAMAAPANTADRHHAGVVEYYRASVIKLVSLAKQRALGVVGSASDTASWLEIADHFDVFSSRDPQTKTPELAIIAAAQRLLLLSVAKRDVIDFDDMIYMPLALNMPFHRYDVVMVDEAQDTNPARRELVKRMLRLNGRVIAVGDRHQAIYGFTGADNDSLDLIANDFNCSRLPLTTTYRCPKAVVTFAKQWVSHIEAHESAPVGKVAESTMEDFLTLKNLNGTCAVLCRNTKPIVSLAFSLICAKVACKVEGRDIGANLIKLINRWKVASLDALSKKLDKHLDAERIRLTGKKQDTKLQTVEDAVETVKVIINQCLLEGKRAVADAVRYVEELFSDDVAGVLVLSTIHKAKGREWERVYWLDRRGTCPSKYAKQAWERAQEVNLCYVAATRAKQSLIELHAPVAAAKPIAPVVAQVTTATPATCVKETPQEAKRRRAKARREKAGREKANLNPNSCGDSHAPPLRLLKEDAL